MVEKSATVVGGYGITAVQGHKYGGVWPAERFATHGLRYEASAAPKSDLYRELLPLLTSQRAELLDDPRLLVQPVALKRRTARGCRDSIDHPPRGHDDLVNAAAGALVAASQCSGDIGVTFA